MNLLFVLFVVVLPINTQSKEQRTCTEGHRNTNKEGAFHAGYYRRSQFPYPEKMTKEECFDACKNDPTCEQTDHYNIGSCWQYTTEPEGNEYCARCNAGDDYLECEHSSEKPVEPGCYYFATKCDNQPAFMAAPNTNKWVLDVWARDNMKDAFSNRDTCLKDRSKSFLNWCGGEEKSNVAMYYYPPHPSQNSETWDNDSTVMQRFKRIQKLLNSGDCEHSLTLSRSDHPGETYVKVVKSSRADETFTLDEGDCATSTFNGAGERCVNEYGVSKGVAVVRNSKNEIVETGVCCNSVKGKLVRVTTTCPETPELECSEHVTCSIHDKGHIAVSHKSHSHVDNYACAKQKNGDCKCHCSIAF